MKIIPFILVVLIVLLSSSVSGQALTTTYDDFSGDNLDLTKWTIEPVRDIPWATGYPSEYYLDTINQTYHTAQTTQANKQLIISMDRLLQSGETLEYDVLYHSSSGNQVSSGYINNHSFTSLVADEYGCHHCGAIGYWDQIMSFGNEYGVYHLEFSFHDDNFELTVTKPDSSTWSGVIHGVSSPYKFEFESRSGHNGLYHIDYDNFMITTQDSPPAPEFPSVFLATPIIFVSILSALLFARKNC